VFWISQPSPVVTDQAAKPSHVDDVDGIAIALYPLYKYKDELPSGKLT
jgi:hypothetical protein